MNKRVAVDALTKLGYTDVEVTHSATVLVGLRGCSEKDAVKFTASGTNVQGQRYDDLIICSGWFLKGATPRF